MRCDGLRAGTDLLDVLTSLRLVERLVDAELVHELVDDGADDLGDDPADEQDHQEADDVRDEPEEGIQARLDAVSHVDRCEHDALLRLGRRLPAGARSVRRGCLRWPACASDRGGDGADTRLVGGRVPITARSHSPVCGGSRRSSARSPGKVGHWTAMSRDGVPRADAARSRAAACWRAAARQLGDGPILDMQRLAGRRRGAGGRRSTGTSPGRRRGARRLVGAGLAAAEAAVRRARPSRPGRRSRSCARPSSG